MDDRLMKNTLPLWKRYTENNDRKAREALILHYACLVKFVVTRLAIWLPPSLQEEDLRGFGLVGLIEAVDRFDLSHNVKFETYAVCRIRGQIIDSLRSLDIMPRSVHRQSKQIENAIAHLSQILGRTPLENEVANYLGISLERYRHWLIDSKAIIMSLDRPVTFEDGEQATLHDVLESKKMPLPTQNFDEKEIKAEMVKAIRNLSEREQLLISLYYNDELTMKEIGQILGVSESRVSQIHAQTMGSLRNWLKNRAEPNLPTYNRSGRDVPVFASLHLS
jgi:RNA polymerase sigma factor for flagellar operon FliA